MEIDAQLRSKYIERSERTNQTHGVLSRVCYFSDYWFYKEPEMPVCRKSKYTPHLDPKK